MEIQQTGDLEGFLDQFRLIKEKYGECARDTGEHFNIFSILDRERDEEKTHSALLTDLLNPDGSHIQGTVFLRLFFERLQRTHASQFTWEFSETELAKFRVTKESYTGDGFIDILIKNADKFVVIENKIGAREQERQIGKYYSYAKKNYKDENIAIIYLTLDGREPSEYMLGEGLEKEKVLRVSYKDHIIKWLAICMKEKEEADISHIKGILFQYQSLLKKLTGQTYLTHLEEFSMKNNPFFKNGNFKLVPCLENFIEFFQKELKNRLSNYIREAVKENGDFFKQYVGVRYENWNEKEESIIGWKILAGDGINVIVLILFKNECQTVQLNFSLLEGKEIRKEEEEYDCGYGYGSKLSADNRKWIDKYDDLDKPYQKYRKVSLEIEGMGKNKYWLLTKDFGSCKYNDFRYEDENFVQQLTDEKQGKELGRQIVQETIKAIESFLQKVKELS